MSGFGVKEPLRKAIIQEDFFSTQQKILILTLWKK